MALMSKPYTLSHPKMTEMKIVTFVSYNAVLHHMYNLMEFLMTCHIVDFEMREITTKCLLVQQKFLKLTYDSVVVIAV